MMRSPTHFSDGARDADGYATASPGDAREPVTTIRPFCNADLPAMLEIWLQHWSFGPPLSISLAKFEQAILARTFFDPATLLLAESDGTLQAWCHYAGSPESKHTAVICAICLSQPCPPEIGEQLLSTALEQAADRGFDRVQAGVVRDDGLGYAGLDPIGHGIAIPVIDRRLSTLLGQSGFEPISRVTQMIASTIAYRPPVSREGLQFRRSTEIRSENFYYSDRRSAASMSHLDVEVHRLVNRSESELARVQLWSSDPEAEIMRPSMAILNIAEAHQRGRLDVAESYLIGALVQSLAGHHIDTVETVIDSDKLDLIAQLQSLHFQPADEGACWAKSIG
jgi:hypothetical protein